MQTHSIPSNFSFSESWSILSDLERSIKAKIESVGIPLREWDIQINYGIKTGFNDAFIVDSAKRNQILDACQSESERLRTADIIRPILRGRDIKRYGYDWVDLWLIWVPWHFPLFKDDTILGSSTEAEKAFKEQYPSVFNHLLRYKPLLESRNKAETGIRYEWYALQRWGANYWDEFSKPKLIYPNMTKFMPFVYDTSGLVTNQKCFIITGEKLAFLTAFLNSSLFKFCFSDKFPELQGKTRELSKIFMDEIPVIKVSDEEESRFLTIIDDVQKELTKEKLLDIDNAIFDLYQLTKEERELVGFIDYGDMQFLVQ